jgi:hypothetical protein
MSLAIEITQYFIPARFPGTTDLLLNTFGAVLGGIPGAILANKLDAYRRMSDPGSGNRETAHLDEGPGDALAYPDLSTQPRHGLHLSAKRVFDLVFSALGLLLLIPLTAVLALISNSQTKALSFTPRSASANSVASFTSSNSAPWSLTPTNLASASPGR